VSKSVLARTSLMDDHLTNKSTHNWIYCTGFEILYKV